MEFDKTKAVQEIRNLFEEWYKKGGKDVDVVRMFVSKDCISIELNVAEQSLDCNMDCDDFLEIPEEEYETVEEEEDFNYED